MPFLLALTLLLTPAYVIKFHIIRFPTDILMVGVILIWIIFGAWLLIKRQTRDFWRHAVSLEKKTAALVALFFLAGIISLLAHGTDRAKLGQFIVLFLQPISIFIIGRYLLEKFPRAAYYFLLATYLLLAAAGFYAVIQYFTLLGLPPAWWGNSDEPKRALGFFIHPNFYALWAAPLLAFLLPDLGLKIKGLKSNNKTWGFAAAWLIGAAGLFLSLSRAGWLGLAAAGAVYLIVAADAKIRKIILIAAACVLAVVLIYPNLRWRLLLPFYGEKSAVSRFSLWDTGWKGIKESPLTGLGLTGFARQWHTLNTDPGLASASHNFPHNIFLDLWVETGLLGLISLAILMGLIIYRGLRNPSVTTQIPGLSNKQDGTPRQSITIPNFKLSVALFLIALICAGMVDNPYFKNDLAMVFWLILSLGF